MEKERFPHKDFKEAYRAAYLIAGYIRKRLTRPEELELDEWITSSDDHMRLFGEVTKEENIAASLAAFEKMKVEEDLKVTKARMKFKGRSPYQVLRIAIAASVLISAGILAYFKFSKKNDQPIAVQFKDITPGTDQATLTMGDGTIVTLHELQTDSSINGVAIVKDGELIYSNKETSIDLVYHTLSIPRKGQFKLTLPDGTRVWLNAESSIRFPVHFNGSERRVFVSGETYFEVAKNKDMPFRVVAGDMTVEALGTRFNINAYSNEPFMTATLTEGSVLVTRGLEENMLQPGQQAQIKTGVFNIASVNTEEVTGWKNDQFVFVNSSLASILRQVERWYDATVVYAEPIEVHLNATIERGVPVSRLLALLEATGHVRFNVEGKIITVLKGTE